MDAIQKAFAISDAKISFVSLVNKAANKKQFLITKAENGSANFLSNGMILKSDADSHYVTGVVYAPMEEDAHGNYMTEEEIRKSAYWFTKNGNQIDIQHEFEPIADAVVVE
ncbi:MAG: XkdF-like putative serine protease domain-containing protein, partial [Clostridia bacterium]|nr:XkdF-like putative serine protease domain-containing protein [Clostridia bacterium]